MTGRRARCPDCGCTCGVCRYRHRVAADAAPPLSHAIVCPVTFEVLDGAR